MAWWPWRKGPGRPGPCALRVVHCVVSRIVHRVLCSALLGAVHCVRCSVAHCALPSVQCLLRPVVHCGPAPVVHCVPCSVLVVHIVVVLSAVRYALRCWCTLLLCAVCHGMCLCTHPCMSCPLCQPCPPYGAGRGGTRSQWERGHLSPCTSSAAERLQKTSYSARADVPCGKTGGFICCCRSRQARSTNTSGRGHHVAVGRARQPGQPPRLRASGVLWRRQPLWTPVWPAPAMPRARCSRLAGRQCLPVGALGPWEGGQPCSLRLAAAAGARHGGRPGRTAAPVVRAEGWWAPGVRNMARPLPPQPAAGLENQPVLHRGAGRTQGAGIAPPPLHPQPGK